MTLVYGYDTPPPQYVYDGTPNSNLTSTSYVSLTPEVGVYFVPPSSGLVLITVGGGGRDNTNDNRVFMSVQITYAGVITDAASVGTGGYGTPGINANHMYGSRSFVVQKTGGVLYYAQLMVAVETTTGTTADVTSRDIIVEPLP